LIYLKSFWADTKGLPDDGRHFDVVEKVDEDLGASFDKALTTLRQSFLVIVHDFAQ